MTFDQKIALWNTVGTWLAGIATLLAVLVSLHLARRPDRIRIKGTAGIRLIFAGDGTPAEEHVQIGVVNHGDRVVIVNSVGWRVGKKSDARRSKEGGQKSKEGGQIFNVDIFDLAKTLCQQ